MLPEEEIHKTDQSSSEQKSKLLKEEMQKSCFVPFLCQEEEGVYFGFLRMHGNAC